MNPIYLTVLIFIVIVISIGTESSLVAIIGAIVVLGLYLHLGLSLRSPNESNRRSLSEDDEEYYVMIRQSEQQGEKQEEKRKYPINPERKKVSDGNLRKKSRTNKKGGK